MTTEMTSRVIASSSSCNPPLFSDADCDECRGREILGRQRPRFLRWKGRLSPEGSWVKFSPGMALLAIASIAFAEAE